MQDGALRGDFSMLRRKATPFCNLKYASFPKNRGGMDELSNPAVHTRKKRVIVVDTETTGLLPYDRIVTIGAVKIEGDDFLHQSLHLIFDPRKDSHPQAEAVHGYDSG